jgi:ribosomal protein L16 Arg81 hydroxylase
MVVTRFLATGNLLLQGYSHHFRISDLQFAHRPPPGEVNDAIISSCCIIYDVTFKPHYDTHDVLVLHVVNSKRWTTYGTPIEPPLAGQGFDASIHDPTVFGIALILTVADVVSTIVAYMRWPNWHGKLTAPHFACRAQRE